MLIVFLTNALIGTILGFLTGLGIGGGSLLILWLTLVQGWTPAAARGANLLFFLPSAIISILFRHRQGAISYMKLLPAVIAGCMTAVIGTYIGGMLDIALLRKLFGALLIAAGLRELFFGIRKKKAPAYGQD